MDTRFDDVRMLPMLPCADVDEIASFWTALGLEVSYRQLRPNPFLALERDGIALQYYGMPDWDPALSHSTCGLLVEDTEPIFDLFVAGLRTHFGRVPIAGFPRITRPRRRANNAGLSGFSLIDPAGNWIRVMARPRAGNTPRTIGDRVEWSSEGGGPVARALENAVVLADSHGDETQAERALAGALRRTPDAPTAEAAAALAFLVELRVRLGDSGGALAAAAAFEALDLAELPERDREALLATIESATGLADQTASA